MEQNPPDRRSQHCCHAPPLASFSPAMISRGHGAILNIGSGAGYAAMPNAAVYTASKHFVRAFDESLRAELAGTGVSVSEAAPGPVESEFDQVAGIEGGATPGQGIFRITAQECAGRYCSGIRESFARNFSWPELSLADENAAPDATTTSRNSCRPSSSQDSLSGKPNAQLETFAHWSRICIISLPRF